MIYRSLLKPILFSFDAESTHRMVLSAAALSQKLGLHHFLRRLCAYNDPRLETEVFGIHFHNPLGLAAGLDKNFEALAFWQALGFGFIEAGGVTAHAQSGNPRPRIFRLPEDSALINRMGFPSEGVEVVKPRAQKYCQDLRKGEDLLAINVAKTTRVSMDEAPEDFARTFCELQHYAEFFIIDVSCPNTGEIARLQEKSKLKEILFAVQERNHEKKPLLVKLGPDLSPSELSVLIEVCIECSLNGIVATNTTSSREGLSSLKSLQTEQGGLSGKPLYHRSRAVVAHIYSETGGEIPIIAVGGVSDCNDVVDMMTAGASLVQIYTALVYEGPFLITRLKKELVRYLNRIGADSIQDLVGNTALKERVRV